jgi:hypothetical protein
MLHVDARAASERRITAEEVRETYDVRAVLKAIAVAAENRVLARTIDGSSTRPCTPARTSGIEIPASSPPSTTTSG